MDYITTDKNILKKRSRIITQEYAEEIKIFDRLAHTLKNHKISGVGLSAIQIGVDVCAAYIFIENGIQNEDDTTQDFELKLLNPQIINESGSFLYKGEGCLSVPGKYFTTSRYNNITITDDINGEKSYTGFLSVVMQHEIDHMNGIIFTERRVLGDKRKSLKIGRNDPCICGSGKKYKKCCG